MGIVQKISNFMRRTSGPKATFKRWKDIYDQAAPGSKLEKFALQNMSEVATTYEEWNTVYYLSELDSELEKTALHKRSALSVKIITE